MNALFIEKFQTFSVRILTRFIFNIKIKFYKKLIFLHVINSLDNKTHYKISSAI